MQNQIREIVFLVFVFFGNNLFAQDSLAVRIKPNPIIFYEGYAGFGGAETGGFTIGGTVNYQFYKHDLVTARIGTFVSYYSEAAFFGPMIAIPIIKRNEQIVDYGLLYGKRWIRGGASFSVSAGVSFVHHEYLEQINQENFIREQNLIGIPFEFNIKFFKNQKRRLRLYYGIIPVTKKKVAFGRSIGFKFVGNISKANYGAFGISYGFGTHKKY